MEGCAEVLPADNDGRTAEYRDNVLPYATNFMKNMLLKRLKMFAIGGNVQAPQKLY